MHASPSEKPTLATPLNIAAGTLWDDCSMLVTGFIYPLAINLKTDSKKLTARFIGPFKITHRLNPVTFRLQLPTSLRIHPVFHQSQLKHVFFSPLSPQGTRNSALDDVFLFSQFTTPVAKHTHTHSLPMIPFKALIFAESI
ncbi:chromobox -like protein [Labeo rohita]|uniref:Chromobox-like protein n=1 Tax=Labeo rohita TaxID=84645 RepID=A0A498MF25_LABRO|nr:chromobox -like protein [Labeo rohita]